MKLSALLATPFQQTIFLDNDIYLLRRDFVSSMRTIAHISDLAMPIDPERQLVPMGCSAIINYNVSRSRRLLQAAHHIMKKTTILMECVVGIKKQFGWLGRIQMSYLHFVYYSCQISIIATGTDTILDGKLITEHTNVTRGTAMDIMKT